MVIYKSREDLKTKIIQTFANEEEVYQIFFLALASEGIPPAEACGLVAYSVKAENHFSPLLPFEDQSLSRG
jgi:hypothetical protein